MSLPKTKEDISMNENTTNVNLSCLDFNVTGEERKRLVHAIGDFTEADEHYLGVPSCATRWTASPSPGTAASALTAGRTARWWRA